MGALTVTITQATPALESDWRALEARAERSFFLSWTFIATAIECAGENLLCARLCDRDDLVGLALLWPVTEQRHGVLRIRQLRLNEYGAHAHDAVPSEFASLLAARGYEAQVFPALIDALLARDDWDEFVVTNLLEADEAQLAASGLKLHRRAEAGSGAVDLDALRAAGIADLGGYLGTLGKNTRAAIARSIRLYGDRGKLRLERAQTTEEALAWFEQIASLQTEKWRTRGRRGMNDHIFLKRFSERLIENGAPSGAVELLRLSAGEEPLAWLCNFVDRRKVLFYIGGFRVEHDNRVKPGLVAHALAVADHLKNGMAVYDFMAGDDRYKTNLGAPGPKFVSVALQRPRLALRIEDGLRFVKQRFLRERTERPDAGTP